MTKSEEVILWQHNVGYVRYYPPMPLFAIKFAAKECGVTEERVKEILRTYGSLMYPGVNDEFQVAMLTEGFNSPAWKVAWDKDLAAEI